jgi:cell wall-associated NlpC family hydrolase
MTLRADTLFNVLKNVRLMIPVGVIVLASACVSTSSPQPQAFPRSRPVPNAPAVVDPPASTNSPATSRAEPAPAPVDSARVSAARELAAPAATMATPAAAAVLQTAYSLLGTRYRFGGESPETGFDCSGFVGYVLRQHGIDMPRTVAEQFQIGRSVAQDDIQIGDLVFFTTTGPGATHIGIVVSAGPRWEFIHAPADGASVRVERFDSGYWQQRWMGARRVF